MQSQLGPNLPLRHGCWERVLQSLVPNFATHCKYGAIRCTRRARQKCQHARGTHTHTANGHAAWICCDNNHMVSMHRRLTLCSANTCALLNKSNLTTQDVCDEGMEPRWHTTQWTHIRTPIQHTHVVQTLCRWQLRYCPYNPQHLCSTRHFRYRKKKQCGSGTCHELRQWTRARAHGSRQRNEFAAET